MPRRAKRCGAASHACRLARFREPRLALVRAGGAAQGGAGAGRPPHPRGGEHARHARCRGVPCLREREGRGAEHRGPQGGGAVRRPRLQGPRRVAREAPEGEGHALLTRVVAGAARCGRVLAGRGRGRHARQANRRPSHRRPQGGRVRGGHRCAPPRGPRAPGGLPLVPPPRGGGGEGGEDRRGRRGAAQAPARHHGVQGAGEGDTRGFLRQPRV
mmetsp:Transcript_292/g.654  ORF Transcript_292/g.654 Transcript_292/m.654 type:complete len:215 (-) Transcript_292:118-762(-)